MYDVPFEFDENGDLVNWSVEAVADEYTPAEGETVKYFAWGMADNAMEWYNINRVDKPPKI